MKVEENYLNQLSRADSAGAMDKIENSLLLTRWSHHLARKKNSTQLTHRLVDMTVCWKVPRTIIFVQEARRQMVPA